MLKSVEIKNFRTHRNTIIDFSKGMNVITGSSDHGKSAILWALIWALNNRPAGGSIKSWTANENEPVEVAIEFDNDWFIMSRNGTKNVYQCEAGTFEALRGNVPDIIQQISNISDCNIQIQSEPYFMLNLSSGDRAKKLNELVGLDIIDRVFKKINSKISDAKKEIVKYNQAITKTKAELLEFEHLSGTEIKIEKLETHINKHLVVTHRRDLLTSLSNSLTQIDDKIAISNKLLQHENKYLSLKNKIQKHEKIKIKYDRLVLLSAKLIQNDISIKQETDWLAVENPYKSLSNKIDLWEEKKVVRKNLNYFYTSILNLDDKIEREKSRLNKVITSYTSLLESVKICPTCYTTVDIKIINSIKEKFKDS